MQSGAAGSAAYPINIFAAKKTDVRRFRTKPSTLPHPVFDGRKKALKKKVKNS
jgi:hypothetical protein